uniref:hypothetical protein n=1 Tax=Leptospira weilii TaxID=28184 RepID=UPI001F31B471
SIYDILQNEFRILEVVFESFLFLWMREDSNTNATLVNSVVVRFHSEALRVYYCLYAIPIVL